jgi:myogenesis-regulating glycosidase
MSVGEYRFNSNGLGIFVDWESPLWVSINGQPNDAGLFCLRGRYLDSPFVNYDRSLPSLNITECQGRDVRHVHDYMSSTYIARPIDIPDEQMFRDPIWSTWAQYKEAVDQNKVIRMNE